MVDSNRRADLVVKAIGWILEMFNSRYLWNIKGELSSKQLNLMGCSQGRSSGLELKIDDKEAYNA